MGEQTKLIKQPFSGSALADPGLDSAQLLSAHKLLSGWIGSMADRVRNPVAGALAALRLVEREINQATPTRPVNQTFIDDVLERVLGRLVELDQYVAELADFGRPVTISRQEFPIRPLLQSVCDNFLNRPGIRSDVSISVQSNPFLVFADPQKIDRMVQALLLNSVEAIATRDHPQVFVRVVADSKDNSLRISVSDNGPGFKGNAQDILLHPFTSSKEAGSGLGLAVVKKYAEAHQGHVELANHHDDQRGAIVTIVLPGAICSSRQTVHTSKESR